MRRQIDRCGVMSILAAVALITGGREALGQQPPPGGQGVYVGGHSGGAGRGGSTGVYVGGYPSGGTQGSGGGYYVGGLPGPANAPGSPYIDREGYGAPGEIVPAPPRSPLEAPATFHLRVPADAVIYFDGQKTKQTGTEREFVTPPLQPWKKYTYHVRVHWEDHGRPVDKQGKLSFRAGDRVNLDLRQP